MEDIKKESLVSDELCAPAVDLFCGGLNGK